MKKQKPLTYTFHIGGKEIETLNEEQCERIAKKISEAMSIYYTAHPDEYLKLKSPNEKNDAKEMLH